MSNDLLIDEFHCALYAHEPWLKTYWRGHHVLKIPSDLWLYQELVMRVRPRTVIETGTDAGGSALWFADLLEYVDGRVYTIDVQARDGRPRHPRLTYIQGDSTDPGLLSQLETMVEPPVLVSLDSDHLQAHVARELDCYAPLVSEGSYLVVEDTNLNGNPVHLAHGPGPLEALVAWLPQHPEFAIDPVYEDRYLVSFNTWLYRL